MIYSTWSTKQNVYRTSALIHSTWSTKPSVPETTSTNCSGICLYVCPAVHVCMSVVYDHFRMFIVLNYTRNINYLHFLMIFPHFLRLERRFYFIVTLVCQLYVCSAVHVQFFIFIFSLSSARVK